MIDSDDIENIIGCDVYDIFILTPDKRIVATVLGQIGIE